MLLREGEAVYCDLDREVRILVQHILMSVVYVKRGIAFSKIYEIKMKPMSLSNVYKWMLFACENTSRTNDRLPFSM